MSYCLGIQVDEGLVFASDSRTNAGIDSVSTFRKVFIFEQPGERVIVLLTAGNLAVTQEVISMVERDLGTDDPERSLFHIDSMFFAAKIVGGQILGERPRDALRYRPKRGLSTGCSKCSFWRGAGFTFQVQDLS
jgi:putative proteasome-type protease